MRRNPGWCVLLESDILQTLLLQLVIRKVKDHWFGGHSMTGFIVVVF
jgi:hypothetical protein